MANRLDTFRNLRDTYISEINRMKADETEIQHEIDTLRIQMRTMEQRLDAIYEERRNTITQLAGIRTVIRVMEDRQAEAKRRADEIAIAAHRANEDKEYSDEV